MLVLVPQGAGFEAGFTTLSKDSTLGLGLLGTAWTVGCSRRQTGEMKGSRDTRAALEGEDYHRV